MAEFATLATVRAHVNLTSTADDNELGLMLDAADELVRSLVGPLTVGAVTERVAVSGGTAILSRRPSGPVTVVDRLGSPVTGFYVNERAGLLEDVPAVSGPVTVTYQAGSPAVPASVTLATAIIAGHLWETQRRPGQSSDRPAGFGGMDGVADATIPMSIGYAIPSRAQDLLKPFMHQGQVL